MDAAEPIKALAQLNKPKPSLLDQLGMPAGRYAGSKMGRYLSFWPSLFFLFVATHSR